jgi:hypothetical protein
VEANLLNKLVTFKSVGKGQKSAIFCNLVSALMKAGFPGGF